MPTTVPRAASAARLYVNVITRCRRAHLHRFELMCADSLFMLLSARTQLLDWQIVYLIQFTAATCIRGSKTNNVFLGDIYN